MRDSKWTYKLKPRIFKGTYERDRKGERVFILTFKGPNGVRRVTFESWQAAKKLGWTNGR